MNERETLGKETKRKRKAKRAVTSSEIQTGSGATHPMVRHGTPLSCSITFRGNHDPSEPCGRRQREGGGVVLPGVVCQKCVR